MLQASCTRILLPDTKLIQTKIRYLSWYKNSGPPVRAKNSFACYNFNKRQILASTKSKAVANNNLNVAQMMIFVLDRLENIVGKGKNADNQRFFLFPQCFQKLCFRVVQPRDSVGKS